MSWASTTTPGTDAPVPRCHGWQGAADDQGFWVRKVSRRTVAGEDRQIEVLYPSMYFGIEKQYTAGGTEIEESHCAVNNMYLNGVRIAVVAPSGQALYYLTDQVDSVKVVVNDSGLPIKRFEYLPYGETWPLSAIHGLRGTSHIVWVGSRKVKEVTLRSKTRRNWI